MNFLKNSLIILTVLMIFTACSTTGQHTSSNSYDELSFSKEVNHLTFSETLAF